MNRYNNQYNHRGYNSGNSYNYTNGYNKWNIFSKFSGVASKTLAIIVGAIAMTFIPDDLFGFIIKLVIAVALTLYVPNMPTFAELMFNLTRNTKLPLIINAALLLLQEFMWNFDFNAILIQMVATVVSYLAIMVILSASRSKQHYDNLRKTDIIGKEAFRREEDDLVAGVPKEALKSTFGGFVKDKMVNYIPQSDVAQVKDIDDVERKRLELEELRAKVAKKKEAEELERKKAEELAQYEREIQELKGELGECEDSREEASKEWNSMMENNNVINFQDKAKMGNKWGGKAN